jgi:asparagine synthase (glutamine-hydrolysing)
MPPIFGILNTNHTPISPEMKNRMTAIGNSYIKPREIHIREVAGGFLAEAVIIEDPSNSSLLSLAENDQWILIADACLYKRGRLSEKLNGSVAMNDAEMLLEAWLKWKENCAKQLYGDFAFVVFNLLTGELFCCRDQIGVRPLFYTFYNELFIFASELRYVLAALPEKKPIREEYIADTLVGCKTQKNLTPFADVFRLPPAHYLSGTKDKPILYWSPDPTKTAPLLTESLHIDSLKEKLISSVTERCSGEGLTGAELSGGLDSSAITGIAADFLASKNVRISTFSNVLPISEEPSAKDEREHISLMAAFKDCEAIYIDKLGSTFLDLLEYSVEVQGCFIQQHFNVFNKNLFKSAEEKNIRSLLSGFGGDELVSARVLMQWNEFIHKRQWHVIGNELFYKGITVRSLLKTGKIGLKYLKQLLYLKSRNQRSLNKLLNKRFSYLPVKPDFSIYFNLRERLGNSFKFPGRTALSWRQYDRIMLDHIPQRLEYCYTAAAQYGIEYKYPLLDVDLIETVMALPSWLKHHHGVNRYAFREAIKEFVPEEIYKRNDKSGKTIPQVDIGFILEKGKILDLINETSNNTYLREFIDFKAFKLWFEELTRHGKNSNYLMPAVFYSYLMMLIYFKNNN